jgi:hypothetical protein
MPGTPESFSFVAADGLTELRAKIMSVPSNLDPYVVKGTYHPLPEKS